MTEPTVSRVPDEAVAAHPAAVAASDLAWAVVYHFAAKRAARMDARWAEPYSQPDAIAARRAAR